MNQRRRQITDAAIALVGCQGSHSLTHRRVDAEAKLPAGSTSNHFRTHKALVDGVLDRLLQIDLEQAEQAGSLEQITTRAELIDALTAVLIAALGPNQSLSRARVSLMTETMNDSVRSEQFGLRRAGLVQAVGAVVARLGVADPEASVIAGILLDFLDGALTHRLSEPARPLDELFSISHHSIEVMVCALIPQ